MKNLNKIILALAAVALPLVSCQKVEEWKPGEPENGPQVYFSVDAPSSLTLSSQESSFTVDIYRVVTTEALTVNLSASGDTDPFTVPSSVNFVAGQNKASIPVEYDFDAIGFDVKKTITFSIADEAQKTQYGNSAYTVTVQIPSPWTLLGKGTIFDNFYRGDSHAVNIYQNDLDPNLFRLDNPFGAGDKPTLRVLQPGETYRGVSITKSDLVGYDDIDINVFHSTYNAEIYMFHPGRFTSLSSEANFVHNVVLVYQENGLPGIVQLAPYYYMNGVGGWNNTAEDEIAQIIFPGYAVLDYSVEAEYAGIFTDPEGVSYAVAEIALGADVDEAWVAVVEGSDIEAAAAAIAAGEIESVSVDEDGTVNVPFPEDAEYGEFSVVAVSFAGEEPQEVAYSTFQFFGAAPADDLAEGDYTFGEDNIMTVTAIGGYNYVVEGLGCDDGSAWNAVYNPVDFTFSVSGVEYGYEEDGCIFGDLYGYWDAAKTLVYGYFSYGDDEDSEGADPLVFSVDPVSHELTAVTTDFEIDVFEYKSGYPFVETAFEVAAGTPVSPVLATKASVAAHSASIAVIKSGTVKFGSKMYNNDPIVIAQ